MHRANQPEERGFICRQRNKPRIGRCTTPSAGEGRSLSLSQSSPPGSSSQKRERVLNLTRSQSHGYDDAFSGANALSSAAAEIVGELLPRERSSYHAAQFYGN